MSTRGLIGIRQDGVFKGIYNHFDSYPSNLGTNILKFIVALNKLNEWDKFKRNMKKVKWVDPEEKPTKPLKAKYLEYADISVSGQTLNDWYCLLRKVQGIKGFKEIHKGKLSHLIDASDFIYDSLFCEYAYIIDLDKGLFEFYLGFQDIPQKESPFGTRAVRKYYPCKLAKIWKISEIGVDKNKIPYIIKEMDFLYEKDSLEREKRKEIERKKNIRNIILEGLSGGYYGNTVSELSDRLEYPINSVRYHLKKLENEGKISSLIIKNKKHYIKKNLN